MNCRAIPIGPQPGFQGVVIRSDLRNGSISVGWEMERNSAPLEPHEARAVGEALIAAADDLAAYKVKP